VQRITAALGPTGTGILMGALIVPIVLGISTTAVALPAPSEDLGFTAPEAAWLLAGFLLAQAMFVAVFGRLGDVRGTRYAVLLGATLIAAHGARRIVSASGRWPASRGGGGGALRVLGLRDHRRSLRRP